MLSRFGVAASLLIFLAGCSTPAPQVADQSNECRWNRNSCLYEGSYEADERAYAEEEARRLNRAQSVRLRRGGW